MAKGKIVRFGVNPPAIESGRPGNIVAGDPVTRLQNYYTDRGGRFYAGVWESSPGRWRVDYREDEFCVLLAGKVVLRGADGSEESFRAGDAFVIPAGFRGTWETVEPVRKYYAIYESRTVPARRKAAKRKPKRAPSQSAGKRKGRARSKARAARSTRASP